MKSTELCLASIDPPPPLHPANVSSPSTKGGGWQWGGQYFGRRQTLGRPRQGLFSFHWTTEAMEYEVPCPRPAHRSFADPSGNILGSILWTGATICPNFFRFILFIYFFGLFFLLFSSYFSLLFISFHSYLLILLFLSLLILLILHVLFLVFLFFFSYI